LRDAPPSIPGVAVIVHTRGTGGESNSADGDFREYPCFVVYYNSEYQIRMWHSDIGRSFELSAVTQT
jgi:hypothetical protein